MSALISVPWCELCHLTLICAAHGTAVTMQMVSASAVKCKCCHVWVQQVQVQGSKVQYLQSCWMQMQSIASTVQSTASAVKWEWSAVMWKYYQVQVQASASAIQSSVIYRAVKWKVPSNASAVRCKCIKVQFKYKCREVKCKCHRLQMPCMTDVWYLNFFYYVLS